MRVAELFRRFQQSMRSRLDFAKLERSGSIHLYAGDIPQNGRYSRCVGLSLTQRDPQHILHDVTQRLPLARCSVDSYQSEDVFEHIEFNRLSAVVEDIHRVLKPGGVFRLSLPDYRCDILFDRCLKNESGNIVFDPGGGGDFVDNRVVDGGHLWFPCFETVQTLLLHSPFSRIDFSHFYDEKNTAITHRIDYSIGHVQRTPDHDTRVMSPYRPMSIVVDCIKT